VQIKTKLLTLLVAASLCAPLAAKTHGNSDEYWDFQIEMGGTFLWAPNIQSNFTRWGINISEICYFTRHVGIPLYQNIVFSNDDLFYDALFGVTVNPVRTRHFSLPISAGCYMTVRSIFSNYSYYSYRDKKWRSRKDDYFNVGIGVNITMEFYFTHLLYLALRMQGAYVFLDTDGLPAGFMVEPSLCLGFSIGTGADYRRHTKK
jgi:hypothetical protein